MCNQFRVVHVVVSLLELLFLWNIDDSAKRSQRFEIEFNIPVKNVWGVAKVM